MSLKEHDNNQYTKEKDKVEEYLLRMVHRYFDIENNYTQQSIEAIIIESIARLKHYMGTRLNFVISLNGKIGKIKITLKDFGGEPAFDKNNAFNKDFGTTADTICEGNDERLSDSRTPLPHVHQDIDVSGLKELIEQCNIIASMQTHANKSIHDMLVYTGANAKIDLILLDYLRDAVLEYKNTALYHTSEVEDIHNQASNTVLKYTDDLNGGISKMELIVTNGINWLEKAYKHTDDSLEEYNTELQRQLIKCISQENIDKVTQLLRNSPRILESGEFALHAGRTAITTHTVSTPLNQVLQANIKLFLSYTDDEEGEITSTLPFVYTKDDATIVVQGGYSDDGEIIIKNKIISGGSSGVNSLIGNVKVRYQVTGTEGAVWKLH